LSGLESPATVSGLVLGLVSEGLAAGLPSELAVGLDPVLDIEPELLTLVRLSFCKLGSSSSHLPALSLTGRGGVISSMRDEIY
jgi:hypothetical protein